jgi:hypothetical protein
LFYFLSIYLSVRQYIQTLKTAVWHRKTADNISYPQAGSTA